MRALNNLVRLFVVLSLALPIVFGPSAYALVRIGDPRCSDVLIVFARGSGQISNNAFDPNRLDPAFSDSGIRSGEEQTNAFFGALKPRISPSLRVKYLSLHNFVGKYNFYGYQAEPAESILIKPNHRKDVPNAYYESVKDGAEELAWYLEDELTSCPLQQVVLGGYSQGAEVVGDGLNILQPEFRPRIAYVAFYGDPKFNPAQSLVPPKTGWWTRGNAPLTTHGILNARRDYIPAGMVSAGSWCASGDVICDAGPFLNINEPGNYLYQKMTSNNVHSNDYVSIWIEKSAPEIVAALKARMPSIANNVGTNVFINKNDKLWMLDLAVVIDTSHSMGKSMQAIKGNVAGLSGELLGAYWQSRVAVVSFDTPTENYFSRVETPFTNDSGQVQSALRNLELRNTDDSRAMYSGLMTAMNELSWRHGAQKKIIVITDAKADNPSPDGWTQSQVAQRAYELDPAVLSFANTSCDETWSCDQSVNDSVQALADGSGGSVNYANLSFGGVDDLNFMLENMALQPVASITGDQTGYVGTPLVLSGDASYDPDAALTTYRWDCNGDGVWDVEADNPNTECTYAEPYSGLVTLQVISEDGGTTMATMPVTVVAGQPPTGQAPGAPNASLAYSPDGVQLTWANGYPSDVVVKVSDADGNLIGYAPGNASGALLGTLGSEMAGLNVSAGNQWGWSDEVPLALDQAKLVAVNVSEDTSVFSVIGGSQIPAQESTGSAPTTTPNIVSATASTGPAPQVLGASTATEPITEVAALLTANTPASYPSPKPFATATGTPPHTSTHRSWYAPVALLASLMLFGSVLLLFGRGRRA